MSDDTSHKLDRRLSEVVKDVARKRSGETWGAVKRANHEMAVVWLALQDPDAVQNALDHPQTRDLDDLDDLVDDLATREFDGDFDPIEEYLDGRDA